MNIKKLLPVIISYFIILFTVVAIGLLLFESFTDKLIAVSAFLFLPYTMLFASLCYNMIDKADNVIHNGLFTTVSVLYLVLSIIVSLFALITGMSLKITCVLEIIVMCIGMVGTAVAFAAKNHIEGKK